MGALRDSMYDAVQQLIEINSCEVTWEKYPITTNARGAVIQNTAADPVVLRATVRIAHEKSGVQQRQEKSAGLSSNFSKFILMLSIVDIREGDIVTETKTGMRWKAGVMDYLSVEGEVYAKQAPLERADGGGDGSCIGVSTAA